MTVREIRTFGDPVLRTACDPIAAVDDRARTLVADLMDTVDADGRAGLAANQIGVGLRAFAWNIDGAIGYVLNPRLVELGAQVQPGPEGCLSLPGLWSELGRATFAAVEGHDLQSRPVRVAGEGLMARCLQHELDHLDGRLFVDRLQGEARTTAMRALRGAT